MINFSELLKQALEAFQAECKEKASDWDGAVEGSLRGAFNFYNSRNAAFEDVSGLKVAKEEAEQARVAAENAAIEAKEEQTKAKHAKEEAEVAIAQLKAARKQ